MEPACGRQAQIFMIVMIKNDFFSGIRTNSQQITQVYRFIKFVHDSLSVPTVSPPLLSPGTSSSASPSLFQFVYQ